MSKIVYESLNCPFNTLDLVQATLLGEVEKYLHVYIKYAQEIPEIYLRYTRDMPEMCPRYVLDLLILCIR